MTDGYSVPQGDLIASIELADIGHAITDKDGHLLFCSNTFRQQTEINCDVGDIEAPWFRADPAPQKVHNRRADLWDQFIGEQRRWQGLVRWHLRDGGIRYFEGTALPQLDGTVILITNDRTDRVQADRSLRQTEELQRQILAVLPLSVCVQALDCTISFINPYLPRRLGQPTRSFVGRPTGDALGEDLDAIGDAIFRKVKATGTAVDGGIVEVTHGPLAGTHWLVYGRPLNEPNGTLSGVLTIAVDRTDSARLRKERTQFVSAIHESQKVEALNNFAGSLAHELSNILHPAGVYARQLSAHPDHPRRKEFAAKISHAALGAGRILRRTLSMAHTDHKSVEACNLVDIVNETLETAQDLAPKALSYQFNVDPEGPAYAKAQPGELRQVLLNLLNNAAEAMCYTGQISIDLTQGHEEPAWPDIIPSGTSPFARISIKDEGPGMESSIRQRIFEPFFTTKSAGRGTGLGLPVVQGLVTGWGGVVSVDTTIGQGTTFHVWIPQPNVTE